MRNVFFITLFHGLKIGFEYIPNMGAKGTYSIEFLCLRFVFIHGVEALPDEQ